MNKKTVIYFLSVLCLVAYTVPTIAKADLELLTSQKELTFGLTGYGELDFITDSTRSYVDAISNKPAAAVGSANAAGGRTVMNAKRSRLGFKTKYKGEDVTHSAKIEIDFSGKNADTAEDAVYADPIPRLRHFYITTKWKSIEVLLGQTSSLFTKVNSDVRVLPSPGKLVDRDPMIQVKTDVGVTDALNFTPAISVLKPVQRDSMVPSLDLSFKLSLKTMKAYSAGPNDSKNEASDANITLVTRFNEFRYATDQGLDKFSSKMGSAVGVGVLLPILSSSDEKEFGNTLSVSGRYVTGKGYGEAFPSFDGNMKALAGTAVTNGAKVPTTILPAGTTLDAGEIGLSTEKGIELIQLSSIYAHVQYYLPESWKTALTFGYSDLRSNNTYRMNLNQSAVPFSKHSQLFAQAAHDFTDQLRGAIELSHVRTDYTDGNGGNNNRIHLSAYYFF